jgi:hypothetical protein
MLAHFDVDRFWFRHSGFGQVNLQHAVAELRSQWQGLLDLREFVQVLRLPNTATNNEVAEAWCQHKKEYRRNRARFVVVAWGQQKLLSYSQDLWSVPPGSRALLRQERRKNYESRTRYDW